ncbi:MAG: hypothetical protein IJ539_00705 [Prevotella sp.]|nr:hypothetical protein [Prevotella sp.]
MEDNKNKEERNIIEFENRYIEIIKKKTRSASNQSVHLLGFVSVSYHGEDSIFVNHLWEKYKNEIQNLEGVLTLNGKVRVYFPLGEAIVDFDGNTFTADENGFVKDLVLFDLKQISIIGREKTDKTLYTKYNGAFKPCRIIESENTAFFDFGERYNCCEKRGIKRKSINSEGENGDGKVSCGQNHSPYRNCTEAFGYHRENSCPIVYNRCIDYNGFGTDCRGSRLFFVGSDCQVLISHCYNEIGMRSVEHE